MAYSYSKDTNKIIIIQNDTAEIKVRIIGYHPMSDDKLYFSVKKLIDDKECIFQKELNTFDAYKDNPDYYVFNFETIDTVNLEPGEYHYDVQLNRFIDDKTTPKIDTIIKPSLFVVEKGVTEIEGEIIGGSLAGDIDVSHENCGIFIPDTTEDGDLSWTNNANLPNPKKVNLKGPKGDNGISPTITVTTLDDGSRDITITDVNGTKEKINLTKGIDGKDGFSPKVTLKKTNFGRTTCISIESLDNEGNIQTTCSEITNGKDGKNGKDGIDGFTPYITSKLIENGTEITIRNKETLDKINIYNGAKGATGDNGIVVTHKGKNETSTPPTNTDKIWVEEIEDDDNPYTKKTPYFLIGTGIKEVRLVDEYPDEQEEGILYFKYLD